MKKKHHEQEPAQMTGNRDPLVFPRVKLLGTDYKIIC